jgi:hypothetical protein
MDPFRNVGRALGLLACAAAVVLGPTAAAPAPAADEPSSAAKADPAAAARLADLDAFRSRFFKRDKSYSPEARAEAEQRLAKLEGGVGAISNAAFDLELARIVALADNAHTSYFARSRSRRYNRAPIRLVPFGQDFYVLRARSEQADLLGSRLTAIDGRAIDDLRAIARSLQGGTPAWRDRNAGYFFESPEQMHALAVARSPEAATYTFAALDGRTIERRIAAEAPDSGRPRPNASRWMWPAPLQGEGPDWRALLSPERAPWSLQDPEVPFRWRDAPDLDAVIVDLRRNDDAEDRPILRFLKEVERERVRLGRPRVVLDMRFNGGGDLTTTAAFMQDWPGRLGPDGRLFVLTSPWTFSAGISSAGYLVQAGGGRVTTVGESPGDRLMFFSEGRPVELPSGAFIGLATERHDYHTGCRGFTDCHSNVVKRSIAVDTFDPAIAAPWTIDAYVAGRDPGLEAVAGACNRPATPASSVLRARRRAGAPDRR